MLQLVADVRELVAEQFEYRELLMQMTLRDLLLRYKQTVMGIGWALFMPLVNTAVFSIIFTRVAPIDVAAPYPVFAYTGLLAWNCFASSLRFSVTSLTSNANIVTKIYFPREIFPFSAILVALVDFAVGFVVLVAMLIYYGIPFSSCILMLPLVILVQAIFTAGVALLLAMANLFYRDVKYLFELLIAVWMFATSVVYPIEMVSGRLSLLLRLNPMSAIIDAYRSILIRGQLPAAGPFAESAVVSIVLLAFAWICFHRAEFSFAERI